MAAVRVAGRSLAYHRAGHGPPLVLLHGGWSDGRAWRPQLEGLSDAFDVIAWDTPGCGGSDLLTGRPTPADYADAVADLIVTLEVDRAHLCGLSFGGGLAAAVYQRHPELATRAGIQDLSEVTHVVYAAVFEKPGPDRGNSPTPG